MRSPLLALVLAVGLFAAACGGDGNEVAAPTSETTSAAETTTASKPAPVSTIAKKGGLYIGRTSQGMPVRLKISASGTTGKLSIEYESSDSTCSYLQIAGPVRISQGGTILDPDGEVRGEFVSGRLAKGKDRGATPSEAKTSLCAVTETVTWEARLR